ncbi:phosphoglycerate dehydrogenase [Psychrobacter pygoscelis]|uniref:phosphoglycerate dehydrogenase n=1 Tax=Psychrobacter pygoscelis TaxID=2488563 RepID=UPI001A955C47|nr:phosphoglycerate dehydrogenase [Psychrobacter pygoscelis]
MKKVLVTCPPMLGMLEEFIGPAEELELELHAAKTAQVLSEAELIKLLPEYDGWIIGDDPATYSVFSKAQSGKLRAAVKWGIGIDNVDFEACKTLGIPITNTPNMFGSEVADVAIALMIGLARQTYYIDREIRQGFNWPKPAGMSISGKKIGIVGFGDIGFNTAKRLMGFDVSVTAYDPSIEGNKGLEYVTRKTWPEGIDELDFLILTCALNKNNYHMLNKDTLKLMKKGSQIVNVARGPLIDEVALIEALQSDHITAAALDVFEVEPLPNDSALRSMPHCIFGSHNGSNTVEGVRRASYKALEELSKFFKELDKND